MLYIDISKNVSNIVDMSSIQMNMFYVTYRLQENIILVQFNINVILNWGHHIIVKKVKNLFSEMHQNTSLHFKL